MIHSEYNYNSALHCFIKLDFDIVLTGIYIMISWNGEIQMQNKNTLHLRTLRAYKLFLKYTLFGSHF